jgi:hypothetical protein
MQHKPDFSKHPDEAVEIGFGLGGHHIEFKPCGSYGASSLSGYEDPDSFERRVASGDYAKYRMEGARVIDKRAALEKDWGLAVRMPMLSAALEPNGVSGLDRSCRMLDTMAVHGSGTYGQLAQLALADEKFSGLDYVGIDIYTQLWRDAGARVGVFQDGRIQWEN